MTIPNRVTDFPISGVVACNIVGQHFSKLPTRGVFDLRMTAEEADLHFKSPR